MPANRTALVVDCDPGVDDVLCLALALASPELDLLAVTTVAGNAAVDVTSWNAAAFLAVCGRADVPVAAGARRALVHAYDHGQPPPHGANGVGGVELHPSPRGTVAEHAVYVLRDVLAAAAPHSVTIAATGPLTNIALLASLHPELLGRIDRLVVMGGSAGRGNITPVAEFNVWTDPEAAQRVLTEPGLEITLVGLDVTRRALLTKDHLAVLRADSALGAIMASMVDGYRDRVEAGWAIHDAVTVAAIIDPAILNTVPAVVQVDTGMNAGRGQTICDFAPGASRTELGNGYEAKGSVSLAVDLDVAAFQQLMIERLVGLGGSTA